MFNFEVLSAYIVTVTTFLILPGPVNLVIVNAALRHGIKGAFWSIVGTNLASLVLITVASLMITSAGAVNTKWLDALTVFGGAYLIYYSYGLWKIAILMNSKLPVEFDVNVDANIKSSYAISTLIRRGFLVGVSNPKDIVFFISFFPPFIIKLGWGILPNLLVLTVIWCILDYVILMAYGLGVKKLATPKVEKLILLLCAVVFLLIGIYAIITSLNNLI